MKVLNELEKEKGKRLVETGEHLVNDVSRMLDSGAAKEVQILKNVGLDKHVAHVESKRRMLFLNKEYSEKFTEGSVFHIDEIKQIGMKYRLFMKPANKYRGKITGDIGPILRRLSEKHEMSLENVNQDSRFFVLAPPKMFEDYKSTSDKITDHLTNVSAGIKQFMEDLVDPDPVLFYRIDAEHFLMLKIWGRDLGLTRRIIGFLTKTAIFANLLLFFLACVVVPTLIWGFKPHFNSDAFNALWHVIGGIATIIMGIIILFPVFQREDDNSTAKFSSKYYWSHFELPFLR